MRVSDFKKKVRRTTEKAFEDLFAAVLAEINIYSRHMSDKFSGVPDRYIAGGRWVELKSLEYARGVVPYGAGMSKEQRIACGELCAADEEVWYLSLITTNKGQFVIWCPMYLVFEQPDNAWNVHHETETGFGWSEKYDGKATMRQLIPRDWYI